MKYVLITPARNEQAFIRRTLDSVVTQTILPERWVIVDDGSIDSTAEIVESYTKRYPWIELIRRRQDPDRNFASKAHSVALAFTRATPFEFDVVGNLDADVSFQPGYMEFLMRKFSEDTELGVAGTPFTQDGGYDSSKHSFEGENYVAGPCQLFRRRCFQDRSHDRTDEGMESSILLRKTMSSSPHAGHGWEGRFAGAFFLWGKRLLPRRIPSLAIVSRGLSDDKETGFAGRARSALRLYLGGHAADEARRDPGVDAFSPA